MSVAISECQRPHAVGIQGREDLRDAAAAVIADEIDLVDLESIKRLSQHVRVGGHGNVPIRADLGIAVRQQVHRYAAADV